MKSDNPRKCRVVDLDEMIETRCTGQKQFVIDMPDRQWRFKARSNTEAAIWVACIIDVTSELAIPLPVM